MLDGKTRESDIRAHGDGHGCCIVLGKKEIYLRPSPPTHFGMGLFLIISNICLIIPIRIEIMRKGAVT
jgi:hypothetical protein